MRHMNRLLSSHASVQGAVTITKSNSTSDIQYLVYPTDMCQSHKQSHIIICMKIAVWKGAMCRQSWILVLQA